MFPPWNRNSTTAEWRFDLRPASNEIFIEEAHTARIPQKQWEPEKLLRRRDPEEKRFGFFLQLCGGGGAAVGKKENIRRGALGGTRAEHTNEQETRGRAAVMQPLCCISAFLKEFLPSLPGSPHSQQDSSDCRSAGDWRRAMQRGFFFKSLPVLRGIVSNWKHQKGRKDVRLRFVDGSRNERTPDLGSLHEFKNV